MAFEFGNQPGKGESELSSGGSRAALGEQWEEQRRNFLTMKRVFSIIINNITCTFPHVYQATLER